MKNFSQFAGKALYIKKKKTEDSKPYIHLFYIFWIITGIILLTPLIYTINNVIGGISQILIIDAKII